MRLNSTMRTAADKTLVTTVIVVDGDTGTGLVDGEIVSVVVATMLRGLVLSSVNPGGGEGDGDLGKGEGDGGVLLLVAGEEEGLSQLTLLISVTVMISGTALYCCTMMPQPR